MHQRYLQKGLNRKFRSAIKAVFKFRIAVSDAYYLASAQAGNALFITADCKE
jgi:predicted nucleic acid-binding protein